MFNGLLWAGLSGVSIMTRSTNSNGVENLNDLSNRL